MRRPQRLPTPLCCSVSSCSSNLSTEESLSLSLRTFCRAQSYYLFRRSEDMYWHRVLPAFLTLYAVVGAAQIALWGGYYAAASSSRLTNILPVLEGAMYSVAFFLSAVAVAVFGRRAASIVLAVPVLGLTSRTLLSRNILLQSLFCAAAFSLRSLTSLGASIIAGTQLDARISVRAAR